MTKTSLNAAAALSLAMTLAGCATPGANLASNVYTADQVNSRQKAEVITILAVTPARVQVDNTQAKKASELVGGLLGAVAGAAVGRNVGDRNNTTIGAVAGGATGVAAGSLVSDKTLVNGVSITYEDNGQTFNSAQVGMLCQFAPGKAILISTSANVTRIQPNATCPAPKA